MTSRIVISILIVIYILETFAKHNGVLLPGFLTHEKDGSHRAEELSGEILEPYSQYVYSFRCNSDCRSYRKRFRRQLSFFIPGDLVNPGTLVSNLRHLVPHNPVPKLKIFFNGKPHHSRHMFYRRPQTYGFLPSLTSFKPTSVSEIPAYFNNAINNDIIITTPTVNDVNKIGIAKSDVKSQGISNKSDSNTESLLDKFTKSLDRFQRKLYKATIYTLTPISPPERRENGISFVQSGLFVYLVLLALSTETGLQETTEIDKCLEINTNNAVKIQIINTVKALLEIPKSDNLKFQWSHRLSLAAGLNVGKLFTHGGAADALPMKMHQFNGTESPDELANILNRMVERDSGGKMRDAFIEEELSSGVRAVLLTTVYLRSRWRAPVTLLNSTWPFHDHDGAPTQFTKMFRVNDIMRYAALKDWDAEVVEIPYATSGLTLVVLVPRRYSLRELANYVSNTSLDHVIAKMQTTRVAVTLPLYTLRMTLLLPNKLQAIGISSLVNWNDTETGHSLRLSHAIQRIMFWSEAGRNAFKDDGIEWDPAPNYSLFINRPHIFFVRWKNITLLSGNFVL